MTRIDDDRILRAFLAAIDATLRTNYFVTDEAGTPRPYLAIKLNPRRLPEVPAPRPMFEIFVHAPRVALDAANRRGRSRASPGRRRMLA